MVGFDRAVAECPSSYRWGLQLRRPSASLGGATRVGTRHSRRGSRLSSSMLALLPAFLPAHHECLDQLPYCDLGQSGESTEGRYVPTVSDEVTCDPGGVGGTGQKRRWDGPDVVDHRRTAGRSPERTTKMINVACDLLDGSAGSRLCGCLANPIAMD